MKILYIVDTDFWNNNKGVHARLFNLYEQFSDYTQYIFYSGKISHKKKKELKKKYDGRFFSSYPFKRKIIATIRHILRLLHLPIPKRLYNPIKQSRVTKNKINKIVRKNKIDIIWTFYIWNYDFANIKTKVYKILDTQDIASEIVENKRKNKLFFPSIIDLKEECRILNSYDLAIAVSKRDYSIYEKELHNKVFYLPFKLSTNNLEVKKENINKIGFIGGDADFNVIALKRLINDILPKLKNKYTLLVYGNVCNDFKNLKQENIKLMGQINNISEAYNSFNILVNPTTMGSGLKIKCVESMSFGKSLVTTDIGAQGIEEGINSSFLLGNTDNEIASQIDLLLNNYEKQVELSRNSTSYIEKMFGDSHYNELKKRISEDIKK